jgi:hypothetical protein
MNPITSLVLRVCRGLRRVWDETVAAQEALIEINTPWRKEGELRWVRRGGGWELHGSQVPAAPVAPREPAVD